MALSKLQNDKLESLYNDYNNGVITCNEYLEKQTLVLGSKILQSS